MREVKFSCFDQEEEKGFALITENGREGVIYYEDNIERLFCSSEEDKKWRPRLIISIGILIITVAIVAGYIGSMIGKASVKIPADIQTEVPAEVPADVQTEEPAEVPADVQTEEPAEVPADVQTEEPAEDSIEESTAKPDISIVNKLTGYYYDNYCDIPVYTFDNRNSCIEEPYVLPYDGNGSKREVGFTFSERIKSITQVNRTFDSIDEVSCSYLEDKDITSFEFNMKVPENDPTRDYRYYFKVTTMDDTSYYFGIRYVHPDLL